MKIKIGLNSASNIAEKIVVCIRCFTPILLVVLFLVVLDIREYFVYLKYSVGILMMAYLVSLIFIYYKKILDIFMLLPYDELMTSKIPRYYPKFMINSFCLTLAISILFYKDDINFIQYSYPALTFLCASRILQYRDGNAVKEFFGVVYSLVIIVIIFVFMRLMGVLSKFEETSVLAMSFIDIPNIAADDILSHIVLSIAVWAILSIFERLIFMSKK